MPLPEASEQEGESVKAGQEPSVKAGQEPSADPGTDVVPAAPRKPRKFSKLVLLTASKDSAKVAGAKRKGVHCIMSLGVPGPATLAKALLKTHPEAQRAIEAAPQEPEQKRSKLEAGEAPAQGAPRAVCSSPASACPWSSLACVLSPDADGKEAGRLAGGPPSERGEEAATLPEAPSTPPEP
ncbi:FLYWCH family member 2 isoform X1 [Microcebus murinus]|uniref:FLYWCH family member 2 isoform X1 n=1 Tax=Microcebus murinus TaxID=30608 RepID=UPI003F6D6580